MLRKLVFIAVAAAFACSKGSSKPIPATPAVDTCSGDSECAADFRCDHEMRRCVCTSDAACPSGQFCNAFTGLCVGSVGGCTSSSACGQGQYCNTALRTCKPLTPFCQPCSMDAECGSGSSCAAHPDYPNAGKFCIAACDTSGACAPGLSCRKAANGTNLCYPAGACGQSNACVPDSLKICAADADCGDPAQSCDLSLKACIARNRTCPAGDACDPQSRLCVHACASDSDCAVIENAPGYQCRANACFRLALCSQDSDCTTGQICQANPDGSKSCRPGCVSNADCPLGAACSTTDPAHPRCTPGCTQNTDCALNTLCDSTQHACVSTQGTCTQVCQDTAVCAIGGSCINSCCVETNLPQTCGETSCGSCPSTGCTINCNTTCFPMNIGPCATLSDCTSKFPALADVRCNATVGQCQVWGHLQPCTSSIDCGMKGFKCLPRTQVGCGGSGNVCFPTEQAAQTACAVGHP